MQQQQNFQRLTELISASLAFLFVYAGASKLLDHANFVNQLHQQLNFPVLAKWIAYLLPLFEIASSTLLVFNRTRRYGLYTTLIMLSGFTSYITVMLMSNSKLPCTCGGVISHLTWKQHLLFNVAFILLNLAGILFESKRIYYEKNIAPA